MMLDRTQRTPAAAAVGVFLGLVATATAQSCSSSPSPTTSPPLTISAGLSQTHFWVGNFMDPFADAIEAETDLAFTRFYAGELVAVGGELDALESGVITGMNAARLSSREMMPCSRICSIGWHLF